MDDKGEERKKRERENLWNGRVNRTRGDRTEDGGYKERIKIKKDAKMREGEAEYLWETK